MRFPKLKIDMALFALFLRFRFKASAYFYGSALGVGSPVAHWAHLGGFLFGMAAAYGLKVSGLEQKAFDTIESKVGWSADPEIVRAGDALEKANFDEAATILVNYLNQKPGALNALEMLQQVQWRRNGISYYLQVTIQLCQFNLKAQDSESAWREFESYSNAGGDKLPATTWLEIARMLEAQGHLERAATEYERLADAHAAEKPSILAYIAAGRLYLKKLNRPDEALKCYEKANSSKVPHLDWQPNIDAGLREARNATLSTAPLALKS